MKHQHIVLREYDFLHCSSQYREKEDECAFYISEKEFSDIESFVLRNQEAGNYLKICMKGRYKKVIQAQNYVGLLKTKAGTTIEILPKIADIENDQKRMRSVLLKMIKTLKKTPFKNISVADLERSKLPLFEIFIKMFLEELATLVKIGIKLDYIEHRDQLSYLKGKLLIQEQIRRNSIVASRFFSQYDEFSINRVENQLIKTTLLFLRDISSSSYHKKQIQRYLIIFDQVSICCEIREAFSRLSISRDLKHYQLVLSWAKIFLMNESFSIYKGDDLAFALLFDMNKLFESYVGNYLKKKLENQIVILQDHRFYLSEEPKKFRLKPDIVINHGEMIADTKWKRLKHESGISQGDMYQLYAYGTKYPECKELYLIYPKYSDVKNNWKYQLQENLILRVLFFDLVEDPDKDRFIRNILEKSFSCSPRQ